MSAAESTPKRNIWIINPVWDLAFLVATPLAILPLIPLISQRWLTPEQISLIVISFASVGHHLPGFMRAYGDKELFARYRWRFLLAPPFFLMLCLLFTVYKLHGLELIILVWATWHGLMQTYGLMRIYDLKRGINDRLTRRLDFWACVLIFICGIVYSDARVFGVMEVFWRTGLPHLDAWWLSATRWGLATVGGVFGIVYARNLFKQIKTGQGVSWLKLALATTTGLLYWVSGTLSTNVLIGVAMFEIFHAIQYYAIVWIYNRKLADRMGEDFGPLGFLFQRRWFFLGLYLLAIALFGSLRYVQPAVSSPMIEPILLAFFTMSAAMHFYFDGFIWKVSQKPTQQNLGIESQSALPAMDVAALTHLGKWAAFAAICFGLVGLEIWKKPNELANEDRIMTSLAEWVPNLPELKYQLSRAELQRGNLDSALTNAEAAVNLRPRSHQMRAQYGAALAEVGRNDEAIAQLQQAVQLAPWLWANHYELGRLYLKTDQLAKAEKSLHRAFELGGDIWLVQCALGDLDRKQARPADATEHYRRALAGKSDHLPARVALIESLAAAGKTQQAIAASRKALERWPNETAFQFALAKSLFEAKNYLAAIQELQRLVKSQPDHLAANILLGNAAANMDDALLACEAFQRANAIDPDNLLTITNLAAAHQLLGEYAEAETLLLDVVARQPDHAIAHYNLGLALLSQDKTEAAREHLTRAWELGHPPTDDIISAIGLKAPR